MVNDIKKIITNTVEPEFYNHPYCQAKVVINARWALKTGSDVT